MINKKAITKMVVISSFLFGITTIYATETKVLCPAELICNENPKFFCDLPTPYSDFWEKKAKREFANYVLGKYTLRFVYATEGRYACRYHPSSGEKGRAGIWSLHVEAKQIDPSHWSKGECGSDSGEAINPEQCSLIWIH